GELLPCLLAEGVVYFFLELLELFLQRPQYLAKPALRFLAEGLRLFLEYTVGEVFELEGEIPLGGGDAVLLPRGLFLQRVAFGLQPGDGARKGLARGHIPRRPAREQAKAQGQQVKIHRKGS